MLAKCWQNVGKKLRKSWENLGKINFCKMLAKSWPKVGKKLGKFRENVGKLQAKYWKSISKMLSKCMMQGKYQQNF